MNGSFAHHVDVEDDAIGAAIYYGGVTALTVSQLDEAMLMRPANAAILRGLQEHASTGEDVDVASLVGTLRRLGLLEAAGGAAGVASIGTGATPGTIRRLVEAVRENARRRRVHQVAVRLAEHAQNESLSVDDIAAAAMPHLAVSAAAARDARTLGDEAMALYDSLAADAPTDVVEWPLAPLGVSVGPQRPGWLVVSGGWTSMGKSWFGLDCSECALDQGRRVLYVTLEMPAREVAERMVARAGLDLGTLQMGGFDRRGNRMSDAEYQLAHDRAQELANGKGQRMTIVDGRCDVRQIGARMTAAAAVGDPYRYVVIDTLNLLTLPRANSRREGIDAALQELKQAAVQHGVTVHVQAQLGRADDKTTRPPRLQDYKESSGIEQIADVALFVHREKADDGSWLDAGAIILAKARSGPSLGLVRTVWDGATYRYRQAPARHGLGVAG